MAQNTPILGKIKSSESAASLDAKYGPYASKAAANAALGENGDDVITAGLTVGVTQYDDGSVKEFWYQPDGQGGLQLVEKQVAAQEETDPTVPAWAKTETKPSYTASEVGAIPDGDKGVAGGVATLGSDGKVPQSQLPSYVDDVLEYSNQSSFPATGESGKIYVALDTNKTYRWSGSAYVEISQSLALGETSSTAFAGNRGKAIEDKIPSGASSSNKLVTANDISGKVDKVANAQENNFASFDSNGGIKDSNCNEGTFIKGVKKGTETLTPISGVVTIPSDIESAQATSVPSTQSARATINSNHVLQLDIPRGADAINPFKGWYDSSSNLPTNPVVGDYAYVKGAESTDPASIYECTTAGSWSDSGRTADTSNVQTFASGEEVNETYIDDTHLVNPKSGALPTADDAMLLSQKLRNINLTETKLSITSDIIVDGYINSSGVPSSYSTTKSLLINVEGYDYIRFIGLVRKSSIYAPNYCAFYSDAEGTTVLGDVISLGFNTVDEELLKEFIFAIPQGAKTFRCNYVSSSTAPLDSNFYCYLQKGDEVVGLIERKIDKKEIEYDEIYSEITPRDNWSNQYINTSGVHYSTPNAFTCKQFVVSPGETYYISGSTGPSSSNIVACFVKSLDGNSSGSQSPITGNDIGAGSNQMLSRFAAVAPQDAVGIRIMQDDSTSEQYHIKCEQKELIPHEIDNSSIIRSVGDVSELETVEKTTIVGALNEVNEHLNDVEQEIQQLSLGRTLKVLLIGSSHGVNTISMFPVLAYHAGIDITVGNLYTGSATLGLYSARPSVQIPYMADNDVAFQRFAVYENGAWSTKSTSTISYALSEYQWDAIILQRGATEDYWNESIANFYQHLLDYIKEHCVGYVPKIYFNSGIADAARYLDSCLTETNLLISSALQQKEQFGIDVIPTAVAVQYARETCLKNTGQLLGGAPQYQCMSCDSQHLDTGIGQYVTGCTVFEKIIGDFFNMSVRELEYLPVYLDVSGNVINTGSQYFTPITDYYSRIAKQCSMLAVMDGEYVAEHAAALNAKYSSLPTTYTITNTLTGCTNSNVANSVSSDEVYMTTLVPNTGLTIQSVTVTMGGYDITSTVYAAYNGYYAIRIGEITGNIEITASAS